MSDNETWALEGRRVTLEEVSLAAGVSTATVSRLLNGTGTVSPKAADKVRAAVDRLGYVPNGLARALASRRSMTIGAIVVNLTSPVSTRTIAAFQTRLSADGYDLLLAAQDGSEASAAKAVQTMLGREVDALLFVGGNYFPKVFDDVQRYSVPFVVTFMPPEGVDIPTISYDHRVATRMAVEHMLELGHRRIALMLGNPQSSPRFRERAETARMVLSGAGLGLDDSHIVFSEDTDLMSGRNAAARLLERGPDEQPTAIVASNDVLAAGALLECQSRSIAVPDRLSIIGSGDSDLGRCLSPALSTIVTPKDSIGTEAAHNLLVRLKGEPDDRRKIIELGIAVRGTSGRVKSSA